MSDTNNFPRPVILWVDHHRREVEAIVKGIGAKHRSTLTTAPLRDGFDLRAVVVTAERRFEERSMAKVLIKIREACPHPDLVLVDLNFHPDHPIEGIQNGRELAIYLRKQLQSIPIGVYTKSHIDPLRNKALISTDGFAVVFEDITKLYERETALSGDIWETIFNKIILKSQEEAAIPPHEIPVPKTINVVWGEGQPLHRSRSFMDAALKLACLALEWLGTDVPEVRLSQLAGGFSGSFVVKADLLEGNKSFVIKIDEDANKLDRELQGYKKIERRIGHDYYLPLVTSGPTWPVKLYKRWWGAFAMAYEGSAKPLLEQTELDGSKLASIYQMVWTDCLCHLYGSPSVERKGITTILSPELKNAANGWEALDSRYKDRRFELNHMIQEAINQALEFLQSNRASPSAEIAVPWVQQVHGDLNCRNILYDKARDSFRIIDFPNVGSPNSLATDFVKAEAELVLIIMDWATGYDGDFARIEMWAKLTGILSEGFIPTANDSSDAEADRVLIAARKIREIYTKTVASFGDPVQAYKTYLLARVLRYLGYSDLTPAKRLLTLVWAGQLLAADW